MPLLPHPKPLPLTHLAAAPRLRPLGSRRRGGMVPLAAGGGQGKLLWLETSSQAALTAALEAGVSTVLFAEGQAALAAEWAQLGRFQAVLRQGDGSLLGAESGERLGVVRRLASAADLKAAEGDAGRGGVTLMDLSAADWTVIPAENLVAAFQAKGRRGAASTLLLATARDAAGGRVLLEALEAGTDGVVLQTNDPREVRALARYVAGRAAAAPLALERATVTAVRPLGMGDRACVDLASAMAPGEGLLVGSFARALFLVHSECAESKYIASRPFRVNAGPVHAYVHAPGGRTAYLSELRSGDEVVVVDAEGRQRTALVGRVKIESRPLVQVEAVTGDGQSHSLLLQNAETVRLVGPSGAHPAGSSIGGEEEAGYVWQSGGGSSGCEGGAAAAPWRAVSVSELREGDCLFVLRQAGARHTGTAVEEQIVER